jgi:hypothetical protein
MSDRNFSLLPFPGGDLRPSLKISGNITRLSHTFSIHYDLHDPESEAIFPALCDRPVRQHDLWKSTCFEFFLGVKDSSQYWEFNLSPSGHWNVYRFDAYRQGMQEEAAFAALPFSVKPRSDALALTLEMDLLRIIRAEQTLEIGVSTVIKLRDDKIAYWALAHPGSEADFHRRDSFTIDLQ